MKGETGVMMSARSMLPHDADLGQVARGREFMYGLLKAYFVAAPSESMVVFLRGPTFRAMLQAIVSDPDMQSEIVGGAQLMRSFLNDMAEASPASLAELLAADRRRLYRVGVPGYEACAPYELEWRGGPFQKAGVLEDLERVYAAAGLGTTARSLERLDYLGVELEYLQRLVGREAEAWESGDSAAARHWLAAEEAFLQQHLAEWVPAFLVQAAKLAATDFYHGHLFMVSGHLTQELALVSYLAEAAPQLPRRA
jgi:TorA maturation chaperone TorD